MWPGHSYESAWSFGGVADCPSPIPRKQVYHITNTGPSRFHLTNLIA